ncbi:indolepyruvate ferredoxin oxidoreductase family protein [Sporichthya polymorpha]|uniref:indolepyruvate ferredoxin oxidoreductase family protein n=1 Tax=Sporichthya polymorpha TaxID=35751 RepID=UPI00035D3D99|nr:indolepyruvate ferredoxin oxidoreductase family protein [Sporichthya polymorpha]
MSKLALSDRYVATRNVVHLTGIAALVRMLLDQRRADRARGLNTQTFVSGYEGSPLAGFDLELGRRRELLDAHDVVFTPGLNEEAAATAVQGSQLAAVAGGMRPDGVVGVWYGKAPGLDRATDAIRHANLMGTHSTGGVLAVVGDDPAAKSSSVPCASEFALADLAIPTLYPADPGEVITFGLHGIELSRASGLWAALKMATAVADGSATVAVEPFRFVAPDRTIDGRPFTHTVTGRLLQPTLGPLERDLHRARLEIARRYAAANRINEIVVRSTDDTIGLVAAGKTWLDLRHALARLGLDETDLRRRGIRLLKLGMVHPLEPGTVRTFAQGLREIVVVEEKRAFLESAIKDVLYGVPNAPAVSGKTTPDGAPLLPPHGELDPESIASALAERLRLTVPAPVRTKSGPTPLPLLPRTPSFCSGCPHNSSTRPTEGSLVGAGIGCHAMVLLMDPRQVGDVVGLTQMGGEGAQWIGMAPFVDTPHLVQNLGDGTFFHSGSLAIRAAVAAGVSITYKLLYNGTVAMTGGQDAVGQLSVPALTRLLAAEGVARTIITTENPRRYRRTRLAPGVQVWSRKRLDEAQRTLAATPGVTVLIHDQECATELRRARKRGLAPTPAKRVVIDERICEGCGDCGAKSGCLSVHPVPTEYGRKTRIHQGSCNLDATCLAGDCPSFVTVAPDAEAKPRRAPALDDADLPAPPAQRPDEVRVRLAGVGGAGVVTVAQVLATAAVIDGRHVRGLDQTGLAQKGGAVVSDLTLSTAPIDVPGRLCAGEADVLIAADLLVAADPGRLAAADPARTAAVVSTAQIPTGSMVVDPTVEFPVVDEVLSRIAAATRTQLTLDAHGLSARLLGSDQYAAILLVGVACQSGALPLPPAAIERALELNGVAVTANVQAFRRGRQAVADPAGLTRALGGAPETEPETDDLDALLAVRTADLTGYSGPEYAAEYAAVVERVRTAEAAVVPGSTALAAAVARNLHKLMAYKDEYEVARLALDPANRAALAREFGPGARVTRHLHPPALRALGLQRKIPVPERVADPAFRALVRARRLRGTRWDPFGRAEVRRVERELVAEYRTGIERLLSGLSPAALAAAVEIAGLPDEVRGYEEIKLANVARYRERLAGALAAYPPAAPGPAGDERTSPSRSRQVARST